MHRLEQGWRSDPLLHPMEEISFGTHLFQILQHHVRQIITLHAFCPEDRTFSMLTHLISCSPEKQPICTMVKLDSILMHDPVDPVESASPVTSWDTAWSLGCTISTPACRKCWTQCVLPLFFHASASPGLAFLNSFLF